MKGSRYDLQFHTFGCKVNTYDTGLLQSRFNRLQVTADDIDTAGGRPRVHILNTCAVTAEASKEAARLARRIKSREPFATIVITGCGAQVDGTVFDTLPAADLVVANSHKGQLEAILDDHFKGRLTERVWRSNIFRKDDLEAGGGEEKDHTRAFLKIQYGCNSFCTYCVIPFARGKSRSISIQDLTARVSELVAQGTREVVLTGVHIGDYEDEVAGRKYLLHDLVAALLANTQVQRLRLSSLEPVELTSELMDLFRDSRLCPHFHMSIQSANSRVLSAMRRQYSAEQVEEALFGISEQVPGAFVGMDVIAGFPGETEYEFADTYQRLERLPWTRLHVFPYSERPGTKAATCTEVVPREVRKLRAQRLRELSLVRFQAQAQAQVGRETLALVLKAESAETDSPRKRGQVLTRDYWPVLIGSDREGADADLDSSSIDRLRRALGRELPVRITGFLPQLGAEGALYGRLLGGPEL